MSRRSLEEMHADYDVIMGVFTQRTTVNLGYNA